LGVELRGKGFQFSSGLVAVAAAVASAVAAMATVEEDIVSVALFRKMFFNICMKIKEGFSFGFIVFWSDPSPLMLPTAF